MKGIAASPGVGIGSAHQLRKISASASRASGQDSLASFQNALERSKKQIEALRDELAASSPEEAGIFEAHMLLLEDPMLIDAVESRITEKGLSAEDAVTEAVAELSAMFEALEDEYIRARAADIRDIGGRICRNLRGDEMESAPGGIWVADEFLPSEIAAAHAAGVAGLVSDAGTLNSHAAILARSLGIPAVFALKDFSARVSGGETLIVDGFGGVALAEPDESILSEYRSRKAESSSDAAFRALRGRVQLGSVTIKANIGSEDEAKQAIANGAQGIGIVRTEFLFVDREHMPTEDEQFATYAAIVRAAQGKPVTIRTLDAGSDKPLSYVPTPPEPNPALGLRGLRICLSMPEIFRPQIRAILRASTLGPVQILLPMVTNCEEFLQARKLVEESAGELRAEGIAIGQVPLGAMVEVPAAALNAEALADCAEFLSIGTNDLVQYTLATDRINAGVAYLYNEMDPAVLELIRMVANAGKKCRRPVSVCGEMGANLQALPALLEIGIREFSMSPGFIPNIRKALGELVDG